MKSGAVHKQEPVSKLYAKALFEFAQERNEVPVIQEHFAAFVEATRTQPELKQALTTYLFSTQEREALAREICKTMGLNPIVQRFVELLTVKTRIVLLDEVYAAFRDLVDKSQGVVRGIVTTVESLSDAETADLQKVFSNRFKKQVRLEPVIDKEILGGLVVQVEGMTFDGSLKTTIRRLRDTLERQAL